MERMIRSILPWIAAMTVISSAHSEHIMVVDSVLSTTEQPDSNTVRQRAIEELRDAAKTEAIGDRPGPTTALFDSLLKMDPDGRESMEAAWDFFSMADSFPRALQISRRLLAHQDSQPLVRSNTLVRMGDSFVGLGRADSALVYFRRMLDLTDSLRRDAPEDGIKSRFHTFALERVSNTYGLLGDSVLAISNARAYQAAMEEYRSKHSEYPKDSELHHLDGLRFLAWILARFHRETEAETLYVQIQNRSEAIVANETATSSFLPLFVEASSKIAALHLSGDPGFALQQTRHAWKVIEDYSRRTSSTRLTQPYESELAFFSGLFESIHGMPEDALKRIFSVEEINRYQPGIPWRLVYSTITLTKEIQMCHGDFRSALGDSAYFRAISSRAAPGEAQLVWYHLQRASILRLAGEIAGSRVHSDSAYSLQEGRGQTSADDEIVRAIHFDRIERACLDGALPRNALDSAFSTATDRWRRDPSTLNRMEAINLEALRKFCLTATDSGGDTPPIPAKWNATLKQSDIGSWLDARGGLVRLLILSGHADAAEKEALAALDTARRFQRLEAAQWIQLNLAHARYIQGKTAKATALYRVFTNKRPRPNAAFDWKAIAKDDLERMRKRFPAIDWSKAMSPR